MKALIGFDNSERMRAASEAACEELLAMPFEDLVRLAKAESSSDLAKFCASKYFAFFSEYSYSFSTICFALDFSPLFHNARA